jgi:hypothetical protein
MFAAWMIAGIVIGAIAAAVMWSMIVGIVVSWLEHFVQSPIDSRNSTTSPSSMPSARRTRSLTGTR